MRFSYALSGPDEPVLPRWARELARQLAHRGSQAPPEVLGPVTALRELRATAVALLAGRPARSPDDRRSLRDDVGRAIDGLGPDLAARAAPALASVRLDLGRLTSLLTETNGALGVASLAEASSEALEDAALVGAAWDDVRAAFEENEFAGTCELRIKQLAELVELRGGDWRSTARDVSRILLDDRFVLGQLGAAELPDLGETRPRTLNEPAGVSLAERLRLARGQFTAEPPTGDMVAWVCFRNAFLSPVYLKVGGVEFFGHQLWPEGIARGYPDNSSPREEFEDEERPFLFHSMPEEPFVVASVPLGHGRLAGAEERARSAARDLIRAARPHSEWSLIKGVAVYVHGSERGWFGDPLNASEGREPERFAPRFEPTSDRLADLDPALVEKLIAGEQQAHDAVRDVEWAEAVARVADAPQRLALSTRLVERALPAPADTHWNEPVSRYLKEWWIDEQAFALISDAASGAVDLLDSVMSPERIEKGWRNRLLPSAGALSYAIRGDEILRSIGELIDDLPEDSLQRRVAAELAQHAASGENWLNFLSQQGRAFDVLLARLVRQRNAVLHGADTIAAVVASVENFTLQLQAFVVHEQLHVATAGEPLLTGLERNRIRLVRLRDRLEAGMPVTAAIFESGEPTDGE